MLSIYLTEELDKIRQSQGATVTYFFCDNKDNKRNTAIAILRGLLLQLVQQHSKLLEYIVPVFKVQKEALFGNSSFESLWRIFESMIRDSSIDSVFSILDGLDECDEDSLEIFIEKLKSLFSKSPTNRLKLIVVSRELPDCIPRAMSSFPHLRLDPDSDHEVNNDLQQFITIKVNELSKERSYPDVLRISIESALLDRAKGTFLWVSFVIGELRKKTVVEVEDTLHHLPIGLEGMYERMLLQIPRERRDIAASILRWVVMAVRPLTLAELSAAIGVKPVTGLSINEAMRVYVGFCGYLLTVIGNNIGLVHQSAKDYLLREGPNLNPQLEIFRIKEGANAEIARTCFTSLGALADGSVQLVNEYNKVAYIPAFPLLFYAVFHWPEHARYSYSLAEDIFDLSNPFYQKQSPIRKAWLAAYWTEKGGYWTERWYYNREAPSSFSLLHLASLLGIIPLTQKLLGQGLKSKPKLLSPVDKRDSEKRTPLFYAVQNGHEAVVRLLLEHKANVDAKDQDTRTALQMAAKGGHERVVKLLLEYKADINSKGEHGETALHKAVAGGHLEVVQLLLDYKADVNVNSRYKGTALHEAAEGGHLEVVQLLLDHKADVNVKSELGWTALYKAAEEGHLEVVQLLLDHKADVNVKSKYGETALYKAAEGGHLEVVQLLLDHKADVNVKSEYGETALYKAAGRGHLEVVQLLLDHKADVNVKDDSGRTARYTAARSGHQQIVRLLKSYNAR
jgi:ankyrin repeat protein